MESKKTVPVSVRIVKQQEPVKPYSVFYDNEAKIEKSDRSEQLNPEEQRNATVWVAHPVDMNGLKALVDNSTILPQCIRAYKNNIAGFGISVRYACDCDEESPEMKAEWERMEEILELLNMDCMTKEVFEKLIVSRETFGIAYAEVIRDMEGNVVQLEFIIDTPSVDMTYPLSPYVDVHYFYKGRSVIRKKKFKKYRQSVGGKTVYFKEFGDPRIMDKRDGEYLDKHQKIEVDYQANEIIEFRLGNLPYGEVRWIGQVLTVDGSRRAEVLNNNYFRKGRHTPLMILIKGGTLSDSSFTKLQEYMNGIEGESGQHSFLVLEADTMETSAAFTEEKQPDIEIKDLASVLQKDELFQEYQENGRKKVQSAFLLPDLYTGYTTDFNRATAQTAMEVTEKQVFQPERVSLAWIINNKLLNGYNFQHVEAYFMEPDITNPDDIQKILNVTERAGGLTPNVAKELTYKVLGKDDEEDYSGEWGDLPLAYTKAVTQAQQADLGAHTGKNMQQEEKTATGQNKEQQKQDTAAVSDYELEQVEAQIQKAETAGESEELLAVMKAIRDALAASGTGGEADG